MSKNLMRILEGLINFVEDLIARRKKKLNLGFNWKKLKLRNWNWTLKSIIGQIKALIVKTKIWQPIRCFNEEIQNQVPNHKKKKKQDFKGWNYPNQGQIQEN
jgi:hypothetical protein